MLFRDVLALGSFYSPLASAVRALWQEFAQAAVYREAALHGPGAAQQWMAARGAWETPTYLLKAGACVIPLAIKSACAVNTRSQVCEAPSCCERCRTHLVVLAPPRQDPLLQQLLFKAYL